VKENHGMKGMKKGMKKELMGALIASAVAGIALSPASNATERGADAKGDKKPYCQNNSCKGKSECGGHGNKNGCHGMNDCKGQGWIKAKNKKECETKKGKWVEEKA